MQKAKRLKPSAGFFASPNCALFIFVGISMMICSAFADSVRGFKRQREAYIYFPEFPEAASGQCTVQLMRGDAKKLGRCTYPIEFTYNVLFVHRGPFMCSGEVGVVDAFEEKFRGDSVPIKAVISDADGQPIYSVDLTKEKVVKEDLAFFTVYYVIRVGELRSLPTADTKTSPSSYIADSMLLCIQNNREPSTSTEALRTGGLKLGKYQPNTSRFGTNSLQTAQAVGQAFSYSSLGRGLRLLPAAAAQKAARVGGLAALRANSFAGML